MSSLRSELLDFLQNLDLQSRSVDHPPVLKVEEMLPHLQEVEGAVSKNLFLKDKKKKKLYLVTARHDHQVNLNDLAKALGLGSGNLRFADEETMKEKLKVGPGCASPLALLFDEALSVTLVLDRDLLEGNHPLLWFHPMTNEASLGLSPPDLLRFLKEVRHDPVLQDFL